MEFSRKIGKCVQSETDNFSDNFAMCLADFTRGNGS